MAVVQQQTHIAGRCTVDNTLLSDADRFIAEDSDTARDKADRLYAKVLERIGTEAKAPALSAAAYLDGADCTHQGRVCSALWSKRINGFGGRRRIYRSR